MIFEKFRSRRCVLHFESISYPKNSLMWLLAKFASICIFPYNLNTSSTVFLLGKCRYSQTSPGATGASFSAMMSIRSAKRTYCTQSELKKQKMLLPPELSTVKIFATEVSWRSLWVKCGVALRKATFVSQKIVIVFIFKKYGARASF